jgi:hypothetical protein
MKDWFSDRARVARLVYALDAALGILAIGGASLYGAAWGSGNVWVLFLSVFVPATVAWSLVCYGAYKGLTSDNVLLKSVFWVHLAGNAIGFPVGTAFAGACFWLWRELRK